MFLKSREIAFLGIMMAFAVLLVTIGGYLEMSTLFFLAAASFLCGIVERNFSVISAVLFLAGSLLLSFFLAPQKLYIATFAAFSIYVIIAEYFEKKVFLQTDRSKPAVEWVVKAVTYHILLAISVWFIKELSGFEGLLERAGNIFRNRILIFFLCFFAAEVIWFLFDRAYIYFMRHYSKYFEVDRYRSI